MMTMASLYSRFFFCAGIVLAGLILTCGSVHAQEGARVLGPLAPSSKSSPLSTPISGPTDVQAAPNPTGPVGGVYSALPARDWMLDPERLNSLFFSTWTHSLLDEARRGLKARAPTSGEVAAAMNDGLGEDAPKDPGIRELALGGILYANAKDWTVWLNGQRVRQDAMPPEILDLRVFKTYIDLRWFDAYTNQVFPIRLRPHQRFNLDSRIFLPG